jgi:putative flippase GtrA
LKESTRIIRFILIGTLNFLIIASVVWLMMKVLGCNYKVSNVTAYVIAQTNNFCWSKYWVFSSGRGRLWREIILFLIAFGCAYGAQFLCLLLMVEVLSVNVYLAQFLGLFIYGAVNYMMNRKLTFVRH